jgi:hypothetical protein
MVIGFNVLSAKVRKIASPAFGLMTLFIAMLWERL